MKVTFLFCEGFFFFGTIKWQLERKRGGKEGGIVTLCMYKDNGQGRRKALCECIDNSMAGNFRGF